MLVVGCYTIHSKKFQVFVCRPVKSHAIGVSVTHSSTTSRSHAKKEKSHATFQI